MTELLDNGQRFVELSHGKTRYFDVGQGAPVVLLHGVGYTAGGTSWYRNIGPLAADLRVLAVDLVGWGIGDRLQQGYSFAYLADFVREFQDALGLTSSHVVGHSMGGWVASVFAYESPERVDRLVLVASGGVARRTIPQMTEFRPPSFDEVLARVSAVPGLSADEAVDWATYDWANIQVPGGLESYNAILAHMNNPETRNRYNTLRRLEKLRAKTLVVWGTDDATNALELGELTAETIPDARLVTFSCGHMLPSDVPAEFNAAVGEFLAT
jgi:pimeloyl-ACP methyl ester carboxylesterase